MECAVDVGNGIACKNSCELTVKRLNELIAKSNELADKNNEVYKGTSAVYYRQAVLSGLIGGFFIVYGVVIQSSLAYFLVPLGVIFLLGMVAMILNGRKMKEMSKKEPIC